MFRFLFFCSVTLSSFSFAQDHISIPTKTTEEQTPSKITKAYQIFRSCIYNEFRSSVLQHVYYRLYYSLSSNPGGLDPLEIQSPTKEMQIAKVVLFAHGTGGHPASFIPIAAKLYEEGIHNLYSVVLTPTKEEPIPTTSIENKINEITTLYLEHGYVGVDFTLVGHSLGAIAIAKIAYLSSLNEEAHISKVISLAGRLQYTPGGEFDWFCKAEKEDINTLYSAFKKNPEKIDLYTFIGKNDEIVPEKSAHIQDDNEREYTIENWGHGGIVFSPKVIDEIAAILSDKE